MTNMILTRGLVKQYGGVPRVKDLDIEVPEKAVYGFLGPNGAGKTTTMKMILGLARPTSGSIEVMGKSVNDRNRLEILKNVGSLIESPSYYGHLTGEENLKIIALLKGIPEKDIRRVLALVRLENQGLKRVSQYSLGMKQRLGLAGALIGSPKLLILDEPTNGLDPAGIQEMRALIRSLPGEYGMTVMVSSHLLSEVDQIADVVGIIAKGELVFQDGLKALHQKSRREIAIRAMDGDAAMGIIREAGISARFEEGMILCPALPDGAIAGLIQKMALTGAGVVRVEEKCETLEDIFLKLTGTAVSL